MNDIEKMNEELDEKIGKKLSIKLASFV